MPRDPLAVRTGESSLAESTVPGRYSRVLERSGAFLPYLARSESSVKGLVRGQHQQKDEDPRGKGLRENA
jgi:hypothetical protein